MDLGGNSTLRKVEEWEDEAMPGASRTDKLDIRNTLTDGQYQKS